MSERRAALVTGASTGIGRATALELARCGFHVFAGVRRPADGESVQTEAVGELDRRGMGVRPEGEERQL